MPVASAQARAGPPARRPKVACTTLASSFLLVCCGTAPVAHAMTPFASALTEQIRAVLQQAWALPNVTPSPSSSATPSPQVTPSASPKSSVVVLPCAAPMQVACASR